MDLSYNKSHLMRAILVGATMFVALLIGLMFVLVRVNSAFDQVKVLKLISRQQCEATREFYIKERAQWEGMVAVVQASDRALPPDVVAGIKTSLDATFVLPDCG